MTSFLPSLDDLTADQRSAYDLFPTNLSRGLVLTKGSARPYLSLGLSFRGGWLSPVVRELVILRVGAATGAAYELFHHVPQAQQLGVAREVVEAVVAGAASVGDGDLDVLLAFVDRLVDGVRGEAPGTDAVRERFSDNEVAEIVLLVGHYVMTALFVKALGVEPEGDAPPPGVLETATTKLQGPQGAGARR
ncbi:MAG: carboxymuconolactone decarboxylase family protein [Segniliparus sp.]|uniref:carboxymuconolactone decarboxylase family protein n=1 Tax=Segniliparus sp. TaxID=2804064 RepID=UPI003F315F9D